MNLVPLIQMKKRKIYLEEGENPIEYKEFLKKFEEDRKIYILDWDGIEKDKPNLCTFQRLSPLYEIWVDFGPRDLGDVVDAFMAGATEITLRNRLCPQMTVSDIREISENKVYENIDFENINMQNIDDLFFNESDGLVNLNNKAKIDQDLRYINYLNNLKMKNKLYSYDSNPENLRYWEKFGAEGLLVDINKFEEFKDAF
jgi:uncharacterized protein related to proFAR isomerase